MGISGLEVADAVLVVERSVEGSGKKVKTNKRMDEKIHIKD